MVEYLAGLSPPPSRHERLATDVLFPANGIGTAVRSKTALRGLGAVLKQFVGAGGQLIDTAPSYGGGKVLAAVGEALASLTRSNVWLQSKIPPESMGYEPTTKLIASTLRSLRTTYLDAMLIHRPYRAHGRKGAHQPLLTRKLRLGAWRALCEARTAGRITVAGVSNYGILYLREIEEAGMPLPSINEIEFHPWVSAQQRELLAYCRARRIHVVAYNSLGGVGRASNATASSGLHESGGGGATRARWTTRRGGSVIVSRGNNRSVSHQANTNNHVAHLARAYNVTEAQILLRYALDQNVSVIPSATSARHVRQNRHLGFKLSEADLRLIETQPRPSGWASFEEANSPHWDYVPVAAGVMANALTGLGCNSGGDWHQDEMCTGDSEAADVCEQQMKCLALLEDFDESNGPFTMLIDYNRTDMSARHVISHALRGNGREDKRRHRFGEPIIHREARRTGAFVLEVHAPAGSVVCFDSGSIHHGKRMRSLTRKRSAATLYYSSP